MNTAVLITAIVLAFFLLAMLIEAFARPRAQKAPKHRCFFDGVKVAFDIDGPSYGSGNCSGKAEYRFAVGQQHPAAGLNGSTVCLGHSGEMLRLSAQVQHHKHMLQETGFWVIPEDSHS